MAKPILVRKSFNAGELSPELHYRDDLAAYVKGCKNLSNMTATPYGAVTRRPPFELLAKIDTALYGIPVRYIPFKFSLSEVFHIIFTDGSGSESTDSTTADLIIFDSDGSQVVFDGVPGPLSVLPGVLPLALSTGIIAMATTVYDPADLQEIHFINVNDFVYLTCGGKYPVQAINRFFDETEGGNRWKIEAWAIAGLTEASNVDSSKVVDVDMATLVATSNFDLFVPSDVGREFSIELAQSISKSWNGTGSPYTTIPFVGQGTVVVITEGGIWNGVVELQSSNDDGLNWETLKEITSEEGSSNGSVEVEITDLSTLVRVVWTDPEGWTGDEAERKLKWRMEFNDTVRAFFRISEYTDAQTAVLTEITPLLNDLSSKRWSLGVFSETTGYPYALTIHDERLCLGGCVKSPNTVYASRVNEWDNFMSGTTETSPYTFTVASDSFDTIRSLKSSRQLNIMTDNSENTMGSRDDNAITSITNISVSSHTNYGSSNVQAIQMADMIWFTMGQSERVRASRYDFASDGQQSIEMSLFASHVTESGIKEMSFRRHPFNSLFCLLNNGTAAALTYEGMQEIKAWARISTVGGEILSASANYSDTGDIIAGVVKRGSSYFLETFGDIDESTVFLDNQTTWLDANFIIGQPIEQDDDGLLVVVHDDTELTAGVDYTIHDGLLTIPGVSSGAVAIGRKFVSRVNPTDISEVAPSGIVKRLTALGMYLLDSGTCTIKINGKESPFTDGLKWVAGQRESGLFDLTTGGDYEQGLDIDIEIDSHRHFTLTGLGYRLSISDG